MWKIHSFLPPWWQHGWIFFFERKLKLIWIKSNIYASSNKGTVYEHVNDHLFIWKIKHDTSRPETWKHCGSNWNEQNFGGEEEEAKRKIENENGFEWVEFKFLRGVIEYIGSNGFNQVTLCSWSILKIQAFSAHTVGKGARPFLKDMARVLTNVPLTYSQPWDWSYEILFTLDKKSRDRRRLSLGNTYLFCVFISPLAPFMSSLRTEILFSVFLSLSVYTEKYLAPN